MGPSILKLNTLAALLDFVSRPRKSFDTQTMVGICCFVLAAYRTQTVST